MDQVVVITGAARGFGFALAQAFMRAGARVVISDLHADAVAQAVEALAAIGPVRGWAADVRSLEQMRMLAQRTLQTWGRFDVWVNNAGLASPSGELVDMAPEDARRIWETNALGVFHGTKVALAHFLPRDQGTLVNIYGAGSFLRPHSPAGLYAASKAWITSFTRTLAKELRGSGVRVIGFHPGVMPTAMLTHVQVRGERGEERLRRVSWVLRALGRPPEVPARRLVELVAHNRKPFVEYRMLRPWHVVMGFARVLWARRRGTYQDVPLTVEVLPPHRVSLDDGQATDDIAML
ncbi:MAG: SDR family oxidoreductase [Chloroflexi bacterium]|nr:SDR family oxidoreductase [Chloroflexota bacterium]